MAEAKTNVFTDADDITFSIEDDYGTFRTRFHMAKRSDSASVNCMMNGKPMFIATDRIVAFTPVKGGD